jgi:hypothetical protein
VFRRAGLISHSTSKDNVAGEESTSTADSGRRALRGCRRQQND